jgi:hypothetical protein
MSRIKVGLVLLVMSLLLCSLIAGCHPSRSDFDKQMRAIVKPYHFSIVNWELNTLGGEVTNVFRGGQKNVDEGTDEVTRYFSNVEQIKELESEIEALKIGTRQGDLALLEDKLDKLRHQNLKAAGTVERLLEMQIREELSQQGIFNPIYKHMEWKIGFPPVNFILESPPHLLVISSRDRIESIREVTLLPGMSLKDMESVEAEIDKLGVSSLVVNLGGIATYPSYVIDTADLRFVINTASEEWLHQYLAFKPLGFLYILDLIGIRRDYEIATMNETVAGMVSKEIGALIYEEYYDRNAADVTDSEVKEPEFDFNLEMREIRRAVDNYLAQGEIELAEEFMEQKRQYLAENGYHIRKLNQAYFAFHGTYADRPTSISPIGVELKELRSQSTSLKEFLETVAAMTSRQDLAESVR